MTRRSHAASRLRRLLPVTATGLLLALGAGCKSTQTESYSLELRNAASEPVTVWLTKTGNRQQEDWLAPEDLSTSRAAAVGQINGVIIPPGRTGTLGPIKGEFEYDALAMLRVYAGSLSFDQILATQPDNHLRVDVPLNEGMNRLTVKGPPLSVDRTTGPTQPPTQLPPSSPSPTR